jgi:hypothetical protein
VDKLEKKVDDGFAETRVEFRAVRAELVDVYISLQHICHTFKLG